MKNVPLPLARLSLAGLLLVLVFAPSLRSTAELQVEPSAAPLTLPAPTTASAEVRAAARALRSNDVQAVDHHLGALARRRPAEAARLRLIAALAAYEVGEREEAADRLAVAADPGGPFEDWRLLLLGELAAERGELAAAQAWYDQLLATCPGSPLAPGAWLEAARLAERRGEPRAALDRIEAARAAGVTGETAAELEKLAWEVAAQLADPAAGREAARRLFVDAPLGSAALQAARGFHTFGEPLDWESLLSGREARQRAVTLLAAEHPAAALSTLDRLPVEERDLGWHLLRARTLTADHRGAEALELLAAFRAEEGADRAALAWERALAAADAGAVRGGRPALPAVDRRALRAASHRYLREVVQAGVGSVGGASGIAWSGIDRVAAGAGPELATLTTAALRRLAGDFLEQSQVEPALDALRLLRRLDPSDVTGSRPLWEMGWAAYRRGNWTGALGVWSELAEIYPETGNAQRGRYWKARALEQIGRPERARDLYAQLVAESDTSDFYGRQALARLSGPALSRLGGQVPPAPDRRTAPEPWNLDRRLRRARQLSDLGLDALALRELELADLGGDPAARRDRTALQAVILGRQGHRTASILLLREAYPALGGPRQMSVPAEVLYAYYPLDYGESLAAHARAQGLPPSLVAGVIRQESAFDPSATSRVGARGLMQLMPATARETAERLDLPGGALRLDEPELNLRLGTAYLRQVLDMFDGDLELAIAGYNGGPNRIRRLWNEAGPGTGRDEFVEQLALAESRDYVKRVLVLADSYRQLYPDLAGTDPAATGGV